MTAVAVTFIVCATLVTLAVLLRSQRPTEARTASILDERLLETVIVTLKSGTTFRGVLYAEDAGAVVLCRAEHVADDGTLVPADGEIVLLRDEIDYVQKP